jgi:hypothetical protein
MTRPRLALVVLVVLAGFALATSHAYLFAHLDLGLDFRVYQRTVTWPLDQLYHDPGTMPFLYPPTAIPLFKPFAMMPAGFYVWSIVSLLAFAALAAAAGGKRVAALALCSPAAIGGLVLGQVPMILAAALFAGSKLRPFLGGVLWGIAAAIKPQLMVFAPLALAVRRDWTMLFGMAAGLCAMVAGSIALFGYELWFDWIAAIGSFSERVEGGVVRTITPAGKAALAGLPTLPFLLFGVVIGVTAVIASAKKVEGELLIGLVVAASIVASPYAYAHDTIAVIPACVVLLLRGPWWAAIPSALIFLGIPSLVMTGLIVGLCVAALWSIRSDSEESVTPSPASSSPGN